MGLELGFHLYGIGMAAVPQVYGICTASVWHLSVQEVDLGFLHEGLIDALEVT